jgi:hypothetical protein
MRKEVELLFRCSPTQAFMFHQWRGSADIWTGASQVEADSYRPQHNSPDRDCRTGHVHAGTEEGRVYGNDEENRGY